MNSRTLSEGSLVEASAPARSWELRPRLAHKGQDVVFREATFQAAREILEPHNFMRFPGAFILLILVPSLV